MNSVLELLVMARSAEVEVLEVYARRMEMVTRKVLEDELSILSLSLSRYCWCGEVGRQSVFYLYRMLTWDGKFDF